MTPLTRSASPTPEQGSDLSSSSSSDTGSDDETVDLAGSESDETESEKEAAGRPETLRLCSTEPGRGKVKNNLDFLSEIYNTAFSKLPKVQHSGDETESAYSCYR